MSLLAYGRVDMWESKVLPNVASLKNVHVAGLPQEALATIAKDLPRAINWAIMISEGSLFITDEKGQHEITPQWLLRDR